MGTTHRTIQLGTVAAVVGLFAVAACSGEDGGNADDRADRTNVEAPGENTVEPEGNNIVLAIVGDAGELNDDTLAVAALVDAQQPDAVFTVGDNEYTTEGRTVASFEESVGGVYGDWIDAGSFFPIPGDHDYGDRCDDADAPADLDAYLEYFDLPVGPEDETYYDVRIGDVHVFALDSLQACHRDGGAKLERQRQWLAEEASASDAALTIVLLHQPPYSSGSSHGSVETLRWDFAAWGVDLVVSGDDHIYERAVHDDVTYVVNGLGGIEAHQIGDVIDGSVATFSDAFGALVLTVGDNGATGSFITVDRVVVDTFELVVASTAPAPSTTATVTATPSALGLDTTWQWQLQGDINTSYDADLYDIDLFDTSDDTIETLRADGRIVICYFSAGSYEEWRPDAAKFDVGDLGATLDGWEDERWLDTRSPSVRAVMRERLDVAAARGCDGVEPDNVTAYINDTGFDLTADDQLDFNRFLADEARSRGLLIGLKNDLEQIPDLVDHFDFAVNEQCHEFDECEAYAAFVERAKPVFNAEYVQGFVDDSGAVCAASAVLGLRTIVLPLDLDDSFRISCD